MRDIKFRAWDSKKNGWLFDSPKGFSMFGEIVIMGEWGNAAWQSISHDEPYRYELEQCTGLNAVDGIEIYDGDIVHVTFSMETSSEEYYNEYTKAVNWDAEYGCWNYGDDDLGLATASGNYTVRVIVNIHENPSLVK